MNSMLVSMNMSKMARRGDKTKNWSLHISTHIKMFPADFVMKIVMSYTVKRANSIWSTALNILLSIITSLA